MWTENLNPYQIKNFTLKTFENESQSLKENPLSDPYIRKHFVLLPKKPGAYKCVFYLSGFAGDGFKNFNFKSFESNLIQDLDEWTGLEAISSHIYVFVNAWTSWGGSQFINSEGCGNYEDMLVKDLVPSLQQELKDYEITSFALLGGSSGGYGALHLASRHPELFKDCLAIAPDSHFEVSLKPEIYHAFPDIENQGGVFEFYKKLKKREHKTNTRSFFSMVNVLAMASCYSKVDENKMPVLPLEREGEFDQELWCEWLKKDPVFFLRERIENLKKLQTLFLSVGEFDQFLLQFGSRRIRSLLLENKVDFVYEEFKGNHFDIGTRRKKALSLI